MKKRNKKPKTESLYQLKQECQQHQRQKKKIKKTNKKNLIGIFFFPFISQPKKKMTVSSIGSFQLIKKQKKKFLLFT